MTIATSLRSGDRLSAVIFDMDGVIVDSHPAHRRAWRQFLQNLGREVSDHDLDFILDGRKRCDILRHFLGDLSETELLEHGRRKDEFFQQSALEVQPIQGVSAFVRLLKRSGVLTAVATSASRARTRSTLERLHLSEYFSATISGNDIAQGKPDPAIYVLACRRLGVPPENALAIEDAVSGIEAARGAGLICLGVASGEPAENLRSAGAVHVIENFEGLSVRKLRALFREARAAETANPTSDLVPIGP
ncbi:MAG TPA: HAD family phosphatase [Terriglobales bacterium]|nr:HAD family phosphatase [Terriglobales bacterium]